MAAFGTEKGEKGSPTASEPGAGALLPQGEAEKSEGRGGGKAAGEAPSWERLRQRPGGVRRLRYGMEDLLSSLADDWRRDCDIRNARFLWGVLALATGAALYTILPDEPNRLLLLAGTLGGALLVWLRARRGARVFALVLLVGLVGGLALASLHGGYFATPVLKQADYARFTGWLVRVEPRGLGEGADERWTVRVDAIEGLAPEETPRHLLLIRKALNGDYHVGQYLGMGAQLIPLQEPSYPGGFDYGRYLWARAIGGQGYLSRRIEVLPAPVEGGVSSLVRQFRDGVEHVRTAIGRQVMARMEQPAAGLAVALSVGKRDYLDEEVELALRQSGLAHILAISGLHMALVAMSVFWFVRSCLALSPYLALTWPIKQWAAGVALVSAGAYLLLSGASVATIRAFVMTSIFLVAIILGRLALTMHNLALALLVVVITQPYGVVEAGLQMSFAATSALIASYDRIRVGRFSRLREHPQMHGVGSIGRMTLGLARAGGIWIGGLATTALVAGLAVLPFSIVHFQQMAPLGLLANLLAMPVVSLIVMPMGLLSVVLVPVGLQALPLEGLAFGLDLVIAAARFVAAHSDARFVVIRGAGLSLPLVVLDLAVFAIHRGRLALTALLPCMVAVLLWQTAERPDLWVSGNGTMLSYRGESLEWQGLGMRRPTLAYRSVLRADGDIRALDETIVPTGSSARSEARANSPIMTGCDRHACFADDVRTHIGEETGLKVALIRKPDAFWEECHSADILVTSLPMPADCPTPMLILDGEALERGGARYIHLDRKRSTEGMEWDIRTIPAVTDMRRPWRSNPM